MDSTKIGVSEEANEIVLGGFLECSNSTLLETQINLEVLSDFSDKALIVRIEKYIHTRMCNRLQEENDAS